MDDKLQDLIRLTGYSAADAATLKVHAATLASWAPGAVQEARARGEA